MLRQEIRESRCYHAQRECEREHAGCHSDHRHRREQRRCDGGGDVGQRASGKEQPQPRRQPALQQRAVAAQERLRPASRALSNVNITASPGALAAMAAKSSRAAAEASNKPNEAMDRCCIAVTNHKTEPSAPHLHVALAPARALPEDGALLRRLPCRRIVMH